MLSPLPVDLVFFSREGGRGGGVEKNTLQNSGADNVIASQNKGAHAHGATLNTMVSPVPYPVVTEQFRS